MRFLSRGAVGALLLVFASARAEAHLMPKQQATLNVRDSAVFAALSIPVSSLRGWDRNSDGRMSPDEFTAQYTQLVAQLSAGIDISTASDRGRRDLVLPSVELDESDPLSAVGATHLLVLVRQSFSSVPQHVRLQLTLFGTAPDEHEFIVKATANGAPEVAVLRATAATHEFFAPLHVRFRAYVVSLVERGQRAAWLLVTGLTLVAGTAWKFRMRRQPTVLSVPVPEPG